MQANFLIELSQIVCAFSIILFSIENLLSFQPKSAPWITSLFNLAFSLLFFIQHNPLIFIALFLLHLYQCWKLGGTYNGGSDYMLFQLLFCHSGLAVTSPSQTPTRLFVFYLGVQVVFSYMIAGWVKLKNPEWRNGVALSQIAKLERYQVPKGFQKMASIKSLALGLTWAMLLFEIFFFLPFFFPKLASVFLGFGIAFHLSNFFLFGLNRFFWTWIATYPLLFILFSVNS